jgi:ferrous iron transport protein A
MEILGGGDMFPLGLLTCGERAEIMEIRERKGYQPCECRKDKHRDEQYRIEDMGIRIGKSIEMLTNEGRGPLLLKVDESRIAMGRGMAMKILVRRNET